jgi:uncharacterized membrane protein YeaQ/YmgE (transglycosylase-associated protein family)
MSVSAGGWIANLLVDGKRGNAALDLALGAAGALAGGFMFWSFGGGSLKAFNIYSMVVACVGAATVLLSYHALFVYPGNGDD